jgi:hypothetical protein
MNSISAATNSRGSVEQIDARLQEIERLADAGEWEEIEIILHRLPGLFSRIADAKRRAILLSAQERITKVQQQALRQSDELAEKLATLKTGQRAAASYRATGALATAP